MLLHTEVVPSGAVRRSNRSAGYGFATGGLLAQASRTGQTRWRVLEYTTTVLYSTAWSHLPQNTTKFKTKQRSYHQRRGSDAHLNPANISLVDGASLTAPARHRQLFSGSKAPAE